jgi:hypothetical protein
MMRRRFEFDTLKVDEALSLKDLMDLNNNDSFKKG